MVDNNTKDYIINDNIETLYNDDNIKYIDKNTDNLNQISQSDNNQNNETSHETVKDENLKDIFES